MTRNPANLLLNEHLDYLKLTCVKENGQPLVVESAANHWSHLDYLGRLLQGEVAARQHVNSASLLGGSKPPVFQSSRPWKASVGTHAGLSNAQMDYPVIFGTELVQVIGALCHYQAADLALCAI
jgi:hypothetical protein